MLHIRGQEKVQPTKPAGNFAKHIFREHIRFADFLVERSASGDARISLAKPKSKSDEPRCIRATWTGSNDKKGCGAGIVFTDCGRKKKTTVCK